MPGFESNSHLHLARVLLSLGLLNVSHPKSSDHEYLPLKMPGFEINSNVQLARVLLSLDLLNVSHPYHPLTMSIN